MGVKTYSDLRKKSRPLGGLNSPPLVYKAQLYNHWAMEPYMREAIQCITCELHWYSLSKTASFQLTAAARSFLCHLARNELYVVLCMCSRNRPMPAIREIYSWSTTFDFNGKSLPVSQIHCHFYLETLTVNKMCVRCAEEGWFRLLFMLTYNISRLFTRIIKKNKISVYDSKMKIMKFRNIHLIIRLDVHIQDRYHFYQYRFLIHSHPTTQIFRHPDYVIGVTKYRPVLCVTEPNNKKNRWSSYTMFQFISSTAFHIWYHRYYKEEHALLAKCSCRFMSLIFKSFLIRGMFSIWQTI